MREMIAFEKVGRTARIVSDGDFSYSYGNVVSVYDGRGKAELTYNRSGFSVSVKDPLGNVSKICYNAFNTPASVTDANGIVTKYTDNNAGLVTRLKRRDGNATRMSLDSAYDGAGRLVREGSKTYRYGYLDKVLSVTDGDTTRTFTYHADGQLASATVGGGHRTPRPAAQTETFLWDSLALKENGGQTDTDKDQMADSFESYKDGISTHVGVKDTYRLSPKCDNFKIYEGYGDNEIRARWVERKKIVYYEEKDWANPGFQSDDKCGYDGLKDQGCN